MGGDHGLGIRQPIGDRAVLEAAFRFAVAGIIEPDHAAARPRGPGVEGGGLCRAHVGAEAAEPDHGRACAVAYPHREPPVPFTVGGQKIHG